MVLSRLGEGAGDAKFLLKCLALHQICLKIFVVLKVCSSIYKLITLWGGSRLAYHFSVHLLDHGISCLPKSFVVHLACTSMHAPFKYTTFTFPCNRVSLVPTKQGRRAIKLQTFFRRLLAVRSSCTGKIAHCTYDIFSSSHKQKIPAENF